jgi:hypothetical protein
MNAATEMTTAPKTRSTIASRLMALLQHPKLVTMKTEVDLGARLIGLGFSDPCSRCWGSGNFGPQQVQGGVCFKCRGKCNQAPKLTKQLEAKVTEAVSGGALDAYAQKLIDQKRTRKAAKACWGDAIKLYAATAWYRHWYEENTDRSGKPGGRLRHAIVDLYEPIYRQGSDLAITCELGRGSNEDCERLLAIKAEYVESLRIMDACHAIALERGLYDASEASEREREAKPRDWRYLRDEQAAYKSAREQAQALWTEVTGAPYPY